MHGREKSIRIPPGWRLEFQLVPFEPRNVPVTFKGIIDTVLWLEMIYPFLLSRLYTRFFFNSKGTLGLPLSTLLRSLKSDLQLISKTCHFAVTRKSCFREFGSQ